MNENYHVSDLTYEELKGNSGGGVLLRHIILIMIINRKEIWENTVGEYIEGFKEGFDKATSD